MEQLNFPSFSFNFRLEGQRKLIYDIIRKKYVVLTPEEWVRQHILCYLTEILGYPAGLLAVERALEVNKLKKRTDIVAYGTDGKPLLIVECKAPEIVISQLVFDQIARYNIALQVPYLFVSNGLTHFTCKIGKESKQITFLDALPDYASFVKA